MNIEFKNWQRESWFSPWFSIVLEEDAAEQLVRFLDASSSIFTLRRAKLPNGLVLVRIHVMSVKAFKDALMVYSNNLPT